MPYHDYSLAQVFAPQILSADDITPARRHDFRLAAQVGLSNYSPNKGLQKHMFLHTRLFRAAQPLLLFGLVTTLAFGQSGEVSGVTTNFTTLGASILRLVVALAGFAFVGLIIWGGLTLATNRPRGLAMIGGGMVGALLSGLAFTLVNTLTGQTVVSTLLLQLS
jgi:hypothetical protein